MKNTDQLFRQPLILLTLAKLVLGRRKKASPTLCVVPIFIQRIVDFFLEIIITKGDDGNLRTARHGHPFSIDLLDERENPPNKKVKGRRAESREREGGSMTTSIPPPVLIEQATRR